MIKCTYDIKLTEEQFNALKEMVQQSYLKSDSCSKEDEEIYSLFEIERGRKVY